MILIYLGLGIFLATHLFTGYARGMREALIGRIGEVPYKGLYSVVALLGFVLLVMGWKAAEPEIVYTPPAWGTYAAYGLMVVTFVLFTAAYLPAGRIKSAAGHPMALGVILGSLAHLLANGDSRSVTVFGAFLAYGIVDRVSYRLRGDSGASGTSVSGDVGAVAGGLVGAFVMVHFLHQYVAGVALAPWELF